MDSACEASQFGRDLFQLAENANNCVPGAYEQYRIMTKRLFEKSPDFIRVVNNKYNELYDARENAYNAALAAIGE